ncbi:hypothetical protein TTHERM_000705122 (macronuclear) [Tetrahymena thermophila SB210]|uniref:Uncharacterized protein n=1 Tax=Tetrahymena thermophila (strain SB210) TaxID=312017 RepID=W7XFQ0_TETTS|nr:hypothetical protein TTHERM_000705122 [Tetrahymena thermophila SB210]EWS75683.1 hypothetical protein TTHERM_000705122 [Tetrahymena thermophila SB210]|eukprot:XP_012651756.1 hypothetical protein TTHERM_000705122 [Tetrahymena thermophila SB210]
MIKIFSYLQASQSFCSCFLNATLTTIIKLSQSPIYIFLQINQYKHTYIYNKSFLVPSLFFRRSNALQFLSQLLAQSFFLGAIYFYFHQQHQFLLQPTSENNRPNPSVLSKKTQNYKINNIKLILPQINKQINKQISKAKSHLNILNNIQNNTMQLNFCLKKQPARGI